MARDLGLLMGSCLRGARCAPTKTQSRVEISPVGAILTRQAWQQPAPSTQCACQPCCQRWQPAPRCGLWRRLSVAALRGRWRRCGGGCAQRCSAVGRAKRAPAARSAASASGRRAARSDAPTMPDRSAAAPASRRSRCRGARTAARRPPAPRWAGRQRPRGARGVGASPSHSNEKSGAKCPRE